MTVNRKTLINFITLLIVIAIWTVGFLLHMPIDSSGPSPQPFEESSASPEPPAKISIPDRSPTLSSDNDTIPAPYLSPDSSPYTTPETITVAPPELIPAFPAYELVDGLTVTLSNGSSAAFLRDRDYNTKRALGEGSSINISATEDIHSLYIIWDLPPGEWTLAGVEPQSCGKDRFIHEYIPLAFPAREAVIITPPNGATICDIYAFSEGTSPDWVQAWQPPWEKADLLALPTHADDELLYFVGVLPYYAGELGYRVQVAYMTNHWNEQPRPHELLNGLWTVGIRNYPVISGFNDLYAESLQQALSMYGFDNFVNYQVELLRRFKPLVVVGHDLNGEYGHGVHMLNARALQAAVESAADIGYHQASYNLYGIWDTPKLYLHLYPDNAINMDWSIPLQNFGGATAVEVAAAGYDCHISQHRWAFAVPRTGPTGHKFGLVRSLVGLDVVGGDMFENISVDNRGMPP